MIAPLRRRHRWMTASLAAVLPVLSVAALAARPDEPLAERLPSSLAAPAAGEVEADLGELLADPAVAVRARTDGAAWRLELDPARPIALPEVLVYWSASPSAGGGLPEDAYLLGGLAGDRARSFALPADALGRAGALVLYSLGHQQVVASTRLPAIGRAAARPGAGTPDAGDATEGESAGGEAPAAAEAPP